jgi:hypothetical protein
MTYRILKTYNFLPLNSLSLRSDSSRVSAVRTATSAVRPETYDSQNDTVRFVVATERPTQVFDFDQMDIIDEVLCMAGMMAPDIGQVPLLDDHSRFEVSDVLGSARDFQMTEVSGYRAVEAQIWFATTDRARDAARLVLEGHVTDVSVGYKVLEKEVIRKGEQKTIGGDTYEGPVRVATKWEIKETSLTPIGADTLAKVRTEHKLEEDKAMNKKLRKFLVRMGLPVDATDEQARQFLMEFEARQDLEVSARSELDQLKAEAAVNQAPSIGASSNPVAAQKNAPQNPSGGGQNQYSRQDMDASARRAAQEAVCAERDRIDGIQEAVRLAGLDASEADAMVRQDINIDQARAAIFEKMKTQNSPVGPGRLYEGAHEADKFRAAVVSGITHRSGAREQQPAAGYEEFRGMSIADIGKVCLERAGISTQGIHSRRQIADMLLSQRSSLSTSDFPSIFMDAAGKRLLRTYQEAPATWRPWVNVVTATDFKDMYGIALSEAPTLELLNENGEYKSGAFKDKQESYRVESRGKIVYLTRKMIINDDLRAFMRIPQLFGAAARRMEADIIYTELLLQNPIMNETGKTLFHADHENLEATTIGPVTTAGLSAARSAVRKQKGLNGSYLDLQPAFLLTPTDQETDAEVLLRSTALPSTEMSSGVYNPWANRLTPISEPRLDAISAKAWYLIADPAMVDTIEVAYLDGNEQPYLDENELFERDAIGYKVRHDFGAGVMEYRSFYKNPGV